MRILTIQFPKQHKGELTEVFNQLVHQISVHLHSPVQYFELNHEFIAELSTIKVSLDQGSQNIVITPIYPQYQMIKDDPVIYQETASVLGLYIVEQYEKEVIETLVGTRNTSDKFNVPHIARYCYNILYHDTWGNLGNVYRDEDKQRRSKKVAMELEEYISEQTTIDLKGFITFRMSQYKKELMDVVEYAIDEYVMDQQYEEFMLLLKYFVQLQEIREDCIHLIQQKGSSFALYNDHFEPFQPRQEHDRIIAEMLETEINIEDIVISSLITASPQQIVIHAKHNDDHVIRTIKIIFGERVQTCTNCALCLDRKDEMMPLP